MRCVPAVLVVACAGGCASMDSIDRRVERILERGGRETGTQVPPTVRPVTEVPETQPSDSDKRPGTVNPTAADLAFTPALPDRDVLARLESYSVETESAERLDLAAVLGYSQRTAREYLTAEEDYILTAISLLIERHQWGPRFFDDVSAAFSATPNADENYQTALNVINTLRATQRLPYGGEVEARLVTRASRQLTNAVGDRSDDATELVLGANLPLLRNAGLIAQESLIQAERDLIYAARDFEDFRRSFFVDIARDYFALVAQQSIIENQRVQLASNERFLENTEANVRAGFRRPGDSRNVRQQVERARSSLADAVEDYRLSLDRFKIRLGIPLETEVLIVPVEIELPEPEVGIDEAVDTALRLRLDLQNQRDRLADSRRAVRNARNQLLPDLDLAGSATFQPNDEKSSAGAAFDLDETDYNASITLGLPLDREIERLNLRSTIISLQRAVRSYEQFRDNLVLEARRAVREIDRARFSIRLQEQAVENNEFRLKEFELNAEDVDPQDKLDAENNLLSSRNDRDRAIRDLRIAILEYLQATGQLRVDADGQIVPLPGMVVRMLEADQATGDAQASPGAVLDPAPALDPGVEQPGVIDGPAAPGFPDQDPSPDERP